MSKKIVTSGKTPARVLAKSLTVGFASRHRMWGTGSCKNLMKMRLICRSVKSVSWATKKASAQVELMHDEHGVTIVTSKSSFLFEKLERRISMGYCRGNRPRSTYL